jgi:hypothetical protein
MAKDSGGADEILRGRWLRFPEYAIEDGLVLMAGQPTAYDPWQELDQGLADSSRSKREGERDR